MLPPGTLTFLWPKLLWLLAALPLIVLTYVAVLKRRRSGAAHQARLETTGVAMASATRNSLPALLWLLALATLLFAVARPQASLMLPAHIETVMLALDMSGSMRATDLEPTRLVAAKNAAKTFVAAQPRHVKIGVVGIAASAAVVQSPTDNREDIVQAIERLQPQPGTALGSGLAVALAAALPDAHIDIDEFMNPRGAKKPAASDKKSNDEKAAPGSNTQAAIVLLSDGQSNVGPDPLAAAQLAADHGVRIYTVGIGTPEGTTVNAEGWSMRVRLDEDALKQIARKTDADYLRADSSKDLKRIYAGLSAKLAFDKKQPMEITSLFAALGAALAAVGAALSMLWFNRVL